MSKVNIFNHNGYLVEKTPAGLWNATSESRFISSFNLDTIFKKIDGATDPNTTGADLFETPELIPDNVRAILEENQSGENYEDIEIVLCQLNALNYTFDYYLDATPYNLRKIA